MAHKVETMAYTNEVPWHGLGEYVADEITTDDMLLRAGLSWGVEKRPMYLEGGAPVPDFFALTRDKDNKVLDVVGNRYIPTQNREAFEFFREFVEAGSAKMETAGSLRGGQYVWGLANLNQSFKLKGKDEVRGYLLLAVPHQQGKSNIAKVTATRVVCNNTLTLALDGVDEVRINHRRAFDAAAVERAKEALGVAREEFSEFEKNARVLQGINLTREDALRILAPVYQPQEEAVTLDDMNPKLASVMHAYDHAPGAVPGNAWGVLNAVTYYSDHIASRSADRRLTNAWFGKTAKQKEKVLARLLDMA